MYIQGNCYSDVKRNIGFHEKSLIHNTALKHKGQRPEDAIDTNASQKWQNSARLVHANLIAVLPFENFVSNAKDAKEVGGQVHESAHFTRDFYNNVIEVFDDIEVDTLKEEFAKSPFPFFCASSDFKDNLGVVHFYYYKEDFALSSQVVLVSKLDKVDSESITEFLKQAAALVGKSISDFGSWVPRGAKQNAVRQYQALYVLSLWKLLYVFTSHICPTCRSQFTKECCQ